MGEMCSSVEGGAWGCIVVAAAFCIQVLAFGTSQSIGIYNIEFLRYFDEGAAAVSLVGAINFGIFLGAGPVASLLMSRWSHRKVVLLGACLTNIGLIFMPFASNLLYMYVFYGFITGLGNCLVYVPSHVLSGLYFSKHRSLATGIATAGSGMGSTVFPIILYHVIQEYGWQGSMFIIAGLNLHLFVFGALLHPVPKALQAKLAHTEKVVEINNKIKKHRKMSNYLNHEYEVSVPLAVQEETTYLNGGDKELTVVEMAEIQLKEISSDIDQEESNATLKMVASTDSSSTSSKDLTTCERLTKHFRAVFQLDFFIFWCSNVCWNAGGAVVLLFFPEYTFSLGIEKEKASIVLTVLGAGSCVGCLLGGLLGNIKHFNRIGVYILGNIGAGLITLLVTWRVTHTFEGLMLICLIFGLMFGIILGLLVVVTADLLGMEALGDGFGYLMLANGIGIFSGPPLGGLLIDAFHDMDMAMYLSGFLTTMGGVVMCLVPLRRKFSSK